MPGNKLKVLVFIASVLSLSWFFAGWRWVQSDPAGQSIMFLIGATALTLFLVSLQAYWIYFDEKAKGTLRRQIGVFEQINSLVSRGSMESRSATREPVEHE